MDKMFKRVVQTPVCVIVFGRLLVKMVLDWCFNC